MNGLLSRWWVRVGIVGGLTYLAYRYLPAGSIWRTGAVAVGAVSAATIVASNVPLVNQVLAGRLPLPASGATT